MKNLKSICYKLLVAVVASAMLACGIAGVLFMPRGEMSKSSVPASATSVVFDESKLDQTAETKTVYVKSLGEGEQYASEIVDGKDEPQYSLKFTKLIDSEDFVLTSFNLATKDSGIKIALTLDEQTMLGGKIVAISNRAFAAQDVRYLTALDLRKTSIEIIGKQAFERQASLVKLDLPETLREIGDSAFLGAGITTLTMDPALSTIGDSAFQEAKLVVVRGSESLRTVGNSAFDITGLKHFQLKSAELTDWGTNVFGENDSVNLFHNTSVKGWGQCAGLSEDGRWVDNESEAKYRLFTDDSRILDFTSSVASSDPITTQDEYGIQYRLTKVGDSFTVSVTGYTGNVSELVVPGKVIYDAKEDLPILSIAANALQGANFRTLSILENSEASIGANAFSNCSALEAVVIGGGYTSIGANAFSNCSALRSLVVGEDVSTIAETAFSGSEGIQTLFVKASFANEPPQVLSNLADAGTQVVVTQTGNTRVSEKFYTNFILDEKSTDLQGVFYKVAEWGDKKELVAYVGDTISEDSDDERAFTSRYAGSDAYTEERGHVLIPDYISFAGSDEYYRVAVIGRYAFFNCSSLVTLELGAHVEQIYDCSLRNCRSLEKFIVSSRNSGFATDGFTYGGNVSSNQGQMLFAITRIQDTVVFDQIKKASANLTEINPAWSKNYAGNVSSVENYAFANCTGLTSFDFGSFPSLMYIGEHAFENTGLKSVDLSYADVSGNPVYVGEEAFSNNYFLETVVVGKYNWFQSVKYVKGKEQAEPGEVNEAQPQYRNPFLHCTALKSFESNSEIYITSDGVLYLMKGDYAELLQYPAGNNAHAQVTINEVSYQGTSYPIRSIAAYAFSSAVYPDEITVGENVYIIGKAAFENCIRLMEVSVGKNVIYIGMEIPENSVRDVEGEICKSGKRDDAIKNIYEQEVFQNCYVLSGIHVDGENQYYESDTNGILYNKGKTELMVYGQGISRLTFTVPSTVTEIAMEAFQYNTHIQRVNIPEAVSKIGAKAFNGCTSLSFLYFRTRLAPKIGEQVFNSTGAYNGGLHLYCIPEPDTWINGSEYSALWEPYFENTERFNSIEEIPDQTQPTNDVYLIYVIDADGNSLSDIRVEYNYEMDGALSRNSTSTNEYGYAVLSLPYDLNPAMLKLLHIYDDDDVFFDYTVENYYLDFETGFTYITLYAVPHVSGISLSATYLNGDLIYYSVDEDGSYLFSQVIQNTYIPLYNKSIESTKAELNTAYLAQTDLLTFLTVQPKKFDNRYVCVTVRGSWDSASWISEDFILYRTAEDAAAGRDPVQISKIINRGQKVYQLIVDPLELSKEGTSSNLFYRVKIEYGDEDARKTVTLIEQLNVKIYHFSLNKETKFSLLDEGIGLKIDSSIPILGGMELSFGENKLQNTVYVQYKEDKTIVGVTVDDRTLEGDNYLMKELSERFEKTNRKNTIDSFKKLCDAIQNRQDKFFQLIDSGKENKISLAFGGTWEIKKAENGKPILTKLSVFGNVKYEFKLQKTWVVWIIPIAVEFKFKADGKLEFYLTFDYEEDENNSYLESIKENRDFNLKLEVELYAGVGCKIASVGVYGSLGLELLMRFSELKQLYFQNGYLTIDFGFYLKVDIGLFKLTQKWSAGKIFGFSDKITKMKIFERQEDGHYLWFWDKGALAASETDMPSFASLQESLAYAISEISTEDTFLECDYNDYEEYGGVNPEIVTYKGNTYQFYIENVYLNKDSEIPLDGKYDSYNYLKLVYRYRTGNSWSKYIVMNDNGKNDTDFAYYADENGIHLLVRSVGQTLSAVNADTYTSDIDLYGIDLFGDGREAKLQGYNTEKTTPIYSMRTAEASVKGYVYGMSVYSTADSVYYAWVGNTENNLFGMSGNSSSIENADGSSSFVSANTTANYLMVMKASLSNIATKTEVGKLTGLKTVTDSMLASLGGRTIFALITDEDCDITTSSDAEGNPDRYIRLIYLDESPDSTATLTPQTVTNAEGNTMTDYMGFAYDGTDLYLAADGDLYRLTAEDAKLSAELYFEGITGNYRFVYDTEGNLSGILTIIFEDSMTSNLYFAPYDAENHVFGKFVQITDFSQGMMVESYSYYWENAKLVLSYVYSDSDGEESDTVKFHAKDEPFEKPNDLVFVSAELLGCDVELSPTTSAVQTASITIDATFAVTVKNDSIETLNSFRLLLLNANGEIAGTFDVHERLIGGGSWTSEVTFTLTDGVTFTDAYTIKVIPQEECFTESVKKQANNVLLGEDGEEVHFAVARPDIAVTADFVIIGGIKYVRLMVQNVGALPVQKGVLYADNGIYDYSDVLTAFAPENEHLYMLSFEDLAPGAFRYFTVELNRVWFTEQYVTVGTYCLSDNVLRSEYQWTNNGATIEIEKNEVMDYGKYTLTYYVDGTIYRQNSYTLGSTISYIPSEEMVKEGYTFEGWFGASERTMPGHDISVYGFYVKNVYSINYYVNGILTYKDDYEYATVADIRAYSPKIGYVFTGWGYDLQMENSVEPGTKVTVTQEINLYGTSTRVEYVLYFMVDGKVVHSESLHYGEKIPNYSYKPKEGYEFDGWSSYPTSMPDHDVYIYGTNSPKQYQIEYVIEKENGSSDKIVRNILFGQEANILFYSRGAGYEYDGWYYSSDDLTDENNGKKISALNELQDGTFVMPAKSFRLTTYERAKEFTIFYIVGSECVHEERVAYNHTIPEYVYTASSGVDVSEWTNLPDSGLMPAGDIIVYGSTEDVQFTITYFTDDEQVGRQSVAFGSTVLFIAAPEKEGYSFLRWALEDGQGHPVTLTDGRMPAYSLIARAQYLINHYQIDWIVDGITVSTAMLEYGATINSYNYTASEGYTFNGWNNFPATMPSEDIAVYGSTSRTIYRLIFHVNGRSVKSFEISYGYPTISYDYAAEVGYTFDGWQETLPAEMPAHDVEIHGTTSVNRYNISYYVDGSLIDTVSYDYRATVQPYTYEAEVGFTFLGFIEEPSEMPAYNMNVYGRTQRNVYHVVYRLESETVATEEYLYGAKILPLSGFEREGFTISWANIPILMPAHDITVEGRFIANEYAIRYYCDGELLYTDRCAFGEQIKLRAPEIKEGYIFNGWETNAAVMPAQDINIYGAFMPNRYQIAFDIDGKIYHREYDFDEEINLQNLGFEGVIGWRLDGEKIETLRMPARDITLVAETESAPFYTSVWFIVVISAGATILVLSPVIALLAIKLKKKDLD